MKTGDLLYSCKQTTKLSIIRTIRAITKTAENWSTIKSIKSNIYRKAIICMIVNDDSWCFPNAGSTLLEAQGSKVYGGPIVKQKYFNKICANLTRWEKNGL